MVDFRKKTIGPRATVGELLRRRREDAGLTLGTVAKKTNIPRHYCEALEEGRYGTLPGLVYGKSFVRVYGAFLRLSVAPLLRAFVHEYTAMNVTRGKHKEPTPTKEPRVAVITPFRVRFALTVCILLFLGVYFVGAVVDFFRPPYMVVESPHDQSIVAGETVRVAGTIDPRASLTVNDVAVGNAHGTFATTIDVQEGANIILVRAFRRHGKETVVTRTVIRDNRDGISRVSLDNL